MSQNGAGPVPPARTGTAVSPEVAPLLRAAAASRAGGIRADTELIGRAYDAAAHWHRGQERRSGDPYVTHPLAVATILAGLGADDQTLCAALLHDTIEDTGYTMAELCAEFGPEIGALVEGVTALDKLNPGRALTAHAPRIVAAAMSGDRRAVTIKVADRLHNMRTLRHLPRAKQERKSRETLAVFSPVAELLGMDSIKSELDTLAATTLRPSRQAARTPKTCGRVLAATTAFLPAAARARWRDEWVGELCTLPTRGRRARFTLQTLRGMPKLAVTLRRPAGRSGAR